MNTNLFSLVVTANLVSTATRCRAHHHCYIACHYSSLNSVKTQIKMKGKINQCKTQKCNHKAKEIKFNGGKWSKTHLRRLSLVLGMKVGRWREQIATKKVGGLWYKNQFDDGVWATATSIDVKWALGQHLK